MSEFVDVSHVRVHDSRADGRMLCHDLKQPVAAILLLASETARLPTDQLSDAVRRRLRLIESQAHGLAEVIDSTLGPGPSDPQSAAGPADLDATLAEVVTTARITHPGRLVLVTGTAGARVRLGQVLVRRVLGNVIDNAVRAAGTDGTVRVSSHRARGLVLVEVDDEGSGWGQTSPGHGLGLAFVSQVMHAAGGSVSSHGLTRGSRVRLEFPVASEAG